MRRVRNLFALITLLSLIFGLLACAPASEEEDTEALNAEAWALVQQAKETLDGKRQELRDLRDQIAGGGEEGSDEGGGEGEEGEEGEGDAGDAQPPEERLAALEQEIDKLTQSFGEQLTEFINSQDIYEDQPFTEVQRAAFDMKAQEDILVAQEYIDKAGNYQKAIDIYTFALTYDPDSELLKEAMARAEELRYMTEERFAAVKKGMTEVEVRENLGTPQPINVREYEERGVTAWFYPKGQRKAAAVYFKEQGGALKVYTVDFNAADEGEEEG